MGGKRGGVISPHGEACKAFTSSATQLQTWEGSTGNGWGFSPCFGLCPKARSCHG